ncbi:uncharacterized protein [Montipora capricornis]|uniref:uncharacterized protein n=1 Tax=Montipora foliosa TaxID=591990 RepID=UPI0035F10FBD
MTAECRMSLYGLLPKRYLLCLACLMAYAIFIAYSSYNHNLHATHHLVNPAPRNVDVFSKKEDNSSCLKNAFKEILLVIVYHYPLYDTIPYLRALYGPAFPHLLFCGPPSNTLSAGILTVEMDNGYLAYECLGKAIREHPGYGGYFYINDDSILKYWKFADVDWEKIWESSQSIDSTPVYEPKRASNWFWWRTAYGMDNCRRAYEDVANLTLRAKKLNGKDHVSTLSKNGNGSPRCFGGRTDVFYIPRKHTRAFSILSQTFYERKVFLEIAVPTIIRFIERNENIGRFPGYYIPGNVNDPRVTDSRFFWSVYFSDSKLWFIHPFKLHRQGIDSKFNLGMLKFFLIEKVKLVTDCKPSMPSSG